MARQVILSLIVLASTIVGTALSSRPWVKACIIALACAGTAAALLVAHEDHQDTEFIKGALAAELASSKPTPAFIRAINESLNRVAEPTGLHIQRLDLSDGGALHILANRQSSNRAGAVRFNLDNLGQAYVKFVTRRPMDGLFNSAMYTVPDLKDKAAQEEFMETLGIVGETAVRDNVPWLAKGQFTDNFKYDPDEVEVVGTNGQNTLRVSIDADFVASIRQLPPYLRNWKAYEEFERKLRSMQTAPAQPPFSTWFTS